MNMTIAKTVATAFAMTGVLLLSACKVDKTQDGEMPQVDVQTKGGQLPAYDVQTAKVKVGTETKTIEVPTATVEMPDDHDAKATDGADASKH